ncbi:MAG: iron-containing alcohol dehydrogenase [Lentisphaerae bacterium]|nr:iron-containing alcohol dehydrogenase [Victivallaceae bacterium]MDD5663064.1 iron-containing alcohol dehydrogenase [Victivallaceae bacterium]NLK82654.1 iron-containing alcohol dehydrogenase [Lentisphaerota bacterium]
MNIELVELLEKYTDTALIFGSERMIMIQEVFYQSDTRKIAVFSGGESADRSGAFAELMKKLSILPQIQVVRFNAIKPEPTIETVTQMLEFLKNETPDEVVAIGGGSPLDAAKAAWLVHQAGGSIHDYFGVNRYSAENPQRKLKKIIAIPTTAGTGSEATPYSNIVDQAMQVKKLISETEIIPAYSFVVPEFTSSMPPSVTRATGCDALAHAIEGFLNVGQDQVDSFANARALEAISLIVKHLPVAITDGNNHDARSAMAIAAALAGMVIRHKPTGLPHLCSFSWFEKIEHGIAVVLLLPAAWRYYNESSAVATRTMQLAPIFGGNTPDEVVDGFRSFLSRCGVPDGLKTFPAITEELLRKTANSATQNKMKLELAPRPVPLEQSEQILSDILQKSL